MAARVRHAHLHQRSLIQPLEPAFWIFALFLLYGAGRIADILADLSSTSRSGWALAWLLLALYAIPVFILVYRLDLYEREPIPVAIAAFAWGALAATALSIEAAGWDQAVVDVLGPEAAARWSAAIVAPLVEETLKGAGIVLLYLIVRDEFDDVMDGFVYGALCGLGFSVVEDVLYFMAAFGGTPAGVLEGFYVRVIAGGLYGHVLYSGLVGMAIGFVVGRRDVQPLGRRLGVAAALCVLAAGAHALWNSPLLDLLPDGRPSGGEWLLVPVALAVKGLPLLILVIVAVKLAHARERRWLDAALVDELAKDGISPEEFEVLRRPNGRRRAVAAMRRRAGRRAGSLLGRLQREQVNLAMVASRVADPAHDPAVAEQRAYCASLRDALLAIPGARSAVPGGGSAAG